MRRSHAHAALPSRSAPAAALLLLATALATVLAVFGVVLGVPAAALAEGENQAVSWSVAPADETGDDGRAWVELELNPGETTTEHLEVRNLGPEEVTFALTAADGYFTATGRFNMLASDAESHASGTWVSIADEVTIAAGGSAVVPFTVTVPADATPGDHAAGVAASVTSTSSGEGTKLGVESRVGFRVMTRVTGVVTPGLSVVSDGEYRISWNPFAPGTLEVSTELENTGDVRLDVDAGVESGGDRITATGLEDGQKVELLPGDRRSLTFSVPGVWPLGPITLPLDVSAATIDPSGVSTPIDTVERSVTVWAWPLPQLAVVAAFALIVVGFGFSRKRRSDRVDRLLDEAREAGRREAELALAAPVG